MIPGFSAFADRRITELVERHRDVDIETASKRGVLSDPSRRFAQSLTSPDVAGRVLIGKVAFVLPNLHWYRVQLPDLRGVIGCCLGSESAFTPFGPATTGTIPPNSRVVVYIPPRAMTGVILCALPPQQQDGRLLCPDWIVQASGAGGYRSTVYTTPLSQFHRGGGARVFNANRPIDATSLDWGKMTETGVGIHVDAYMTFMRVNEACELTLHYWDDHARLAGRNFDLLTAASSLQVRDDEGELQEMTEGYVYPWEALGMYAPGDAASQLLQGEPANPKDVVFSSYRSNVDVSDGLDDVTPVARRQSYGGFLGQGGLRQVVVPGRTTGISRSSDPVADKPDFGVFRESIGLDGSFTLESAKGITIGKRGLIEVPRRSRRPEDTSDQADTPETYAASAKFGKVAPATILSDIPNADGVEGLHQRLVSVFDHVTREYWKPLGPFVAHAKDFGVPTQKQVAQGVSGAPQRAVQSIDLSGISRGGFVAPPAASKVKVDHRQGETRYFANDSYLTFLDDGGVVLGDGFGSQIVMSGGKIRIECPGDVEFVPGRNFVVLGGHDAVIRARDSVDVTAGQHDVRIKAERNLQMLGGNKTSGGVLIESQSPGFAAQFENRVGEDVVMGGVVLKAPKSAVAVYAGDVMIRTGTKGNKPGDLAKGQIVLDAARGEGSVITKSRQFLNFAASAAYLIVGPTGDQSDVKNYFALQASSVAIGKDVTINGRVTATGSGWFDGNMIVRDGYLTLNNPTVSLIKGQSYSEGAQQLKASFAAFDKEAPKIHASAFPDNLYQSGRLGDDKLIADIAFSLRDDVGQQQYGSSEFRIPESRWQLLLRHQLASGTATAWDEPAVSYQGVEQLPYPGRRAWSEDDSMFWSRALELFDVVDGVARAPTTAAFANPTGVTLERGAPAKHFRTIG